MLVFDGDCGFCRCSARFLEQRVRPRAAVVAYQQADLDGLSLTTQQCSEAVQWVSGDVRRSGARAIAAVLREGAIGWRIAATLIDAAPVRPLAGYVYRLVARNRSRLVQFCRE
ncbi:MAG: thiol-disulfide oxidoreductase DCC family protein [Ilumatobacteraceae bacterium]